MVAMVGGLLYLRFFQGQSSAPIPVLNQISAGSSAAPTSSPLEGRVQALEEAVILLAQKVGSTAASDVIDKASSGNSYEERIKTLEATVNDLQGQITQLKQSSSQTTQTTSTNKAPLYIPLGWSGTTTSTNWTVISSQSMTIDPGDYPGYTSMQFEVSLRAYQGNGKAFARLSNDDGTSIIASEVSITSGDYTWVSSSSSTLPGKKTYKLELKSLTGYEAGAQNARIKVNF